MLNQPFSQYNLEQIQESILIKLQRSTHHTNWWQFPLAYEYRSRIIDGSDVFKNFHEIPNCHSLTTRKKK